MQLIFPLFDLEMPVENATVMLRHRRSQFIYVLGMKRNSEAWLRQLSKTDTYKKQADLAASFLDRGADMDVMCVLLVLLYP